MKNRKNLLVALVKEKQSFKRKFLLSFFMTCFVFLMFVAGVSCFNFTAIKTSVLSSTVEDSNQAVFVEEPRFIAPEIIEEDFVNYSNIESLPVEVLPASYSSLTYKAYTKGMKTVNVMMNFINYPSDTSHYFTSSEVSNIVTTFRSEIQTYFNRMSQGYVTINIDFVCSVAPKSYSYYLNYTGGDDYNIETSLFDNGVAGKKGTNGNVKSFIFNEYNFKVNAFAGTAGAWSSFLWPHAWVPNSNLILMMEKVGASSMSSSTMCHEMMHTFGVGDLYSYASDQYAGCQGLDMMASSTKNMTTNAYFRNKVGWIAESNSDDGNTTPIENITQGGDVSVTVYANATTNYGKTIAYKFGEDATTGEFFMLEYRVQSYGGVFDTTIARTGIVVYRINPSMDGNGNVREGNKRYEVIYIGNRYYDIKTTNYTSSCILAQGGVIGNTGARGNKSLSYSSGGGDSYIFTGSNSEIVVTVNSLSTETANVTISFVSSSITYALDGGTNSSSNPAYYTKTSTVVLNNPTKTGYKFTGWKISGLDSSKLVKGLTFAGTSKTFVNNDLIKQINSGSYGNITLTATWIKVHQLILSKSNVFNNGAKYSSSSDYVAKYYFIEGSAGLYKDAGCTQLLTDYGTTTTGKGVVWSNVPTYSITGYNFNGWSTYPKTINGVASGEYRADGGSDTWFFNGDGKLNDSDTSIFIGGPKFLYDATNGYTCSSSGMGYNDYVSNSDNVFIWTNDIILFPAITTISYTITYSNSGSTVSNSTTYNIEENIALNSPTKTGYNFKGWEISGLGSGEKIKGILFDGTTKSSMANGDDIKQISKGSYGSITLTALWTLKSYTITYSNSGSTVSNPTTYNIESTVPLNNPTKTGYDFKGWEISGLGSGEKIKGILFDGTTKSSMANGDDIKQISKGSYGSITLTAQWAKIIYTLNFLASNYGSVTKSSVEVEYGTSITISNTLITSNGTTLVEAKTDSMTDEYEYFFHKWSWSEGTYQITEDRQEIVASFYRVKRSYNVQILANNSEYGSVSSSTVSVEYGTILAVNASNNKKITVGGTTVTATPTTQNAQYSYGFTNWTIDGGASANNYKIIGATKVFANFSRTPRTYSIYLTTNGGTINSGNVTSYTYGVGATLPTDITRSGFIFANWYDNSDFSSGNVVTSVGSNETGDKYFYARWRECVDKPGSTLGSFTYDGTEKTFYPQNYDANKMNISGNKATNAGSYNATVSLLNDNFIWRDGTQSSITRSFKIEKAQLKISADNKTITYGDSAPTYTCVYTGFVSGENASNLSSAVSYSCAYNISALNSRKVGTYNIVPTGATAQNYQITYETGTLTVNKKALTIKADNKTIIYGGTPTYTCTYTGFVFGETESALNSEVIYNCDYNVSNANTRKVGTYNIVPTGATAENYAITFVNAILTVNKAGLTITAEAKTITYGDSAPTYTCTYTGFVMGEDESVLSTPVVLTCSYNNSDDANNDVGTYNIVPTGATAQNYAITFVNAILTVNKAGLTITADDKTITYGDSAPIYTCTYTGFVMGEDESVLLTPVVLISAYDNSIDAYNDVGTYNIIASGATAQNYTIRFEKGTLTVNKAGLTISAVDEVVIYGENPPVYTCTYTGFVLGEDERVLLTPVVLTCSYNNLDEANNDVGTYEIVVSNATARNYEITFINGELIVNKAGLTITAVDDVVIYGENPPVYTCTYVGFVMEENESVLSTPVVLTCSYNNLDDSNNDVGTYEIVVSNATAQNYEITFVNAILTVNKAGLTITADDKTITYGDSVPTYTCTYTGFVMSEDESVLSTPVVLTCSYNNLDDSNNDVGTYEIVVSNATAQNYSITFVDAILTVNKAELTITADDKTITYGDSAPTYTCTYVSFVMEENESVLLTPVVLTCSYNNSDDANNDVGTYEIVVSNATAQNYEITFINGELIVNKAGLTITAVDKSMIYGDIEPTYTCEYAGFVMGEDENVLNNPVTFACDYDETNSDKRKVGEYVIEPLGATARNYEITFINGCLTVSKAQLIITAQDMEITYGDDAPEYASDFVEFKFDDNESVLDIAIVYVCAYNKLDNLNNKVGEYVIKPTSATDYNYEITFVNGTLTVVKKQLNKPTEDSTEFVYNGEVQEYQPDTNFDSNTMTISGNFEKDAGKYTITISLKDTFNYKWTGEGDDIAPVVYVEGFVIEKAPLTITALNKTITYGDDAPEYTCKYEGFVLDEDSSVLNVSVVYYCDYDKNVVTKRNVGNYDIKPAEAEADNYEITFVNGILKVNKTQLIITAENKTITYGDDAPIYTCLYSGFKYDDNEDVLSSPVLYSCGYNTEIYNERKVGEYVIEPISATAQNYAIEFISAILTVEKAKLTITAENKTITYGDDAPEYTCNYIVFKFDEDESVLITSVVFICDYNKTNNDKNNVGTYEIVVGEATSENYDITFVNGWLTVVKKQLNKPTEDLTNFVYNGLIQIYNPVGFIAETMNIVGNEEKDSGKYTVTITLKDTHNYKWMGDGDDIDPVVFEEKFIINKAQLIVTVENEQIYYGDDEPEHKATFEGFVNNEEYESVFANEQKVELSCDYDKIYYNKRNAGDYNIVITGPDEVRNYKLTYENSPGKLTVNKKELIITANSHKIVAGSFAPDYTYKVDSSCLVYGEQVNEVLSDVKVILRCSYDYNNPTTDVYDIIITTQNSNNEPISEVKNYELSLVDGVLVVSENSFVAKPIVNSTKNYVYNGEVQVMQFENLNERYIDKVYTISNYKQINAGIYWVKISLCDKDVFKWDGETTEDLNFEFVIEKKVLEIEARSYEIKYGDELPELGYSFTGLEGKDDPKKLFSDETSLELKCSYVKNNPVGTYSIEFTQSSSYYNSNNRIKNYNVILSKGNLEVVEKEITKPTADLTKFTYNGSEQIYNPVGFDEISMGISNNKQTNAKTYSVVVYLKNNTNYKWSDGTKGQVYFDFVINKFRIESDPAPVTTDFIYTGIEQTFELDNVDIELMEITGDKRTNCGEQDVVVKLKDSSNYEWNDGSINDKTFEFEIKRLTLKINVYASKKYDGTPISSENIYIEVAKPEDDASLYYDLIENSKDKFKLKSNEIFKINLNKTNSNIEAQYQNYVRVCEIDNVKFNTSYTIYDNLGEIVGLNNFDIQINSSIFSITPQENAIYYEGVNEANNMPYSLYVVYENNDNYVNRDEFEIEFKAISNSEFEGKINADKISIEDAKLMVVKYNNQEVDALSIKGVYMLKENLSKINVYVESDGKLSNVVQERPETGLYSVYRFAEISPVYIANYSNKDSSLLIILGIVLPLVVVFVIVIISSVITIKYRKKHLTKKEKVALSKMMLDEYNNKN